MISSEDFFNHYATFNHGFLHANSEGGTEELLEEIGDLEYDKILEIGIGTGATLVKLAARNRFIKLTGVDISKSMLKKARSRISFSGLKNRITLKQIEGLGKLPFEDNSFDIVYIESVLAIQRAEVLVNYLQEIYRVLTSKGKMVLNETLWLTETTEEEVKVVNDFCLENYGVIQASGEFPYPENWQALLYQIGFNNIKLSEMKDFIYSKKTSNLSERLSWLFSFIGRLKIVLFPNIRRDLLKLESINPPFAKGKKHMNGVLISATK